MNSDKTAQFSRLLNSVSLALALGLGLGLAGFSAQAQDQKDDEQWDRPTRPAKVKDACERYFELPATATDMTKLVHLADCLNRKTNRLTGTSISAEAGDTALSELEALGAESYLEQVLSEYKTIADLYSSLCTKCPEDGSGTDADCTVFNQKIRRHAAIVVGYPHALIIMGQTNLLKYYISKASIYDVNKIIHRDKIANSKFRFTLAELAAGYPTANLDVLKLLVESGYVNFKSTESFPLHSTIINNRQDRFDYLMSQSGIDVNIRDEKPLSKYLNADQLRTAEDNLGQTPIITAIAYRRRAMFETLLSRRDTELNLGSTSTGITPVMLAAYYAVYDDIIGKDGKAQRVTSPKDPYFEALLNDARTDINQQTLNGQSILTYITSQLKYPFVPASQGIYIQKIISRPDFKIDAHCTKDNPCLQPAILLRDAKKLEWYKPLFAKADYNAQIYPVLSYIEHKGKKINGRQIVKRERHIEYYDLLGYAKWSVSVAKTPEDVSGAKAVLALVKKWQTAR